MTVRAHFDGRSFVPDEAVDLPQGTEVTLTITVPNGVSPLQELMELAKAYPITDSPPDWSEQHDHYIHGTPKR